MKYALVACGCIAATLIALNIIAASTAPATTALASTASTSAASEEAPDALEQLTGAVSSSGAGEDFDDDAPTNQIFAAALKYPNDCKDNIVRDACSKNGCYIAYGKTHHKCKKGDRVLTLIPNSIKPTFACKKILKIIDKECTPPSRRPGGGPKPI